MKTFHAARRVEFHQTDAAGIMHFASFFIMMEEAEHEFLRSLGLSVMMESEGLTLSWPRVSAKCEYRAPARFEDLLSIELCIGKLGSKSVRFDFRFLRGEALLAEGSFTTVCCEITAAGPKSTPVPGWIAEKFQPFVTSSK